MRPFDLDWIEFLRFAHTWEALSPELREAAISLRRNETAELEAFEDTIEALEKAGLFERYDDGDRVQPTESFQPILEALRLMKRLPVLLEPTAQRLEDYMADVLSLEERSALAGQDPWSLGAILPIVLASRRYLEEFLESDAAFWERKHLPTSTFPSQDKNADKILAEKQAGEDLRKLLRTLMQREAPIPLVELPSVADGLQPRELADAIWAGLRYGLAFAGLDGDDRPALGIWPTVSERLHRPPVPAPRIVTPDLSSCLAWSLEDLVQLLVFCSEPRRVRTTDRALFAKSQAELEALLVPIPEWIPNEPAAPLRVHRARWTAESQGLVAISGHGGSSMRLQLTDEGRAWLALEDAERAERYLAPLRLDDDEDGHEFAAAHGRDSHTEEIAAAFGALEGPVLCQAFLDHNAECGNPLLKSGRARRPGSRDVAVNDEVLEKEWSKRLMSCMERTLLPNGGLRTGRCGPELTIELTDVGRYLLGLSEELHWPSAADAGAILVQPDFEIVFLTSSPTLESSLTRFAERIGQDIGILFRLTRSSVQTASRAGLTADAMLLTLQEVSKTPLPENVVREIRGWCSQTVQLAWEPMQIIRCEDEETAVRVLAASKGKLEMIAPTILGLSDPSLRTAITSSCGKEGLFIDLPEEVSKPGTTRRRRSSWGW